MQHCRYAFLSFFSVVRAACIHIGIVQSETFLMSKELFRIVSAVLYIPQRNVSDISLRLNDEDLMTK